MEKITSRISNLYIGKVITINIFAALFITICVKYVEDIYRVEKRIFAWVIIVIIIAFLLTIWIEVFRLKKIVIDSEGMKIYNVFSSYKINFSDVDEIISHKFKMSISTIQVTDGYTYSELKLKQKNSIIITPEKFENYLEIMSAIQSNLSN